MLCPVCNRFHFTKLSDDEIEQLGMTPNTTQCRMCGWFYDLEQLKDPDLSHQSNEMSLNQYKAWYEQKIKESPKWEYYLDFIGDPEPHKCPVCGEYEFKDLLCSDICPICGWEDTGFEDEPDEKPGPYMMSLNEHKKWFAKQRESDPSYVWYSESEEIDK